MHTKTHPPETFVKQVKDVLEHLYDFPYLQRHPLAQFSDLSPGELPSQRLRRAFIDAVETLNPGPDVPFRAPHARIYNLLLMHYVEGMTVQETARELGISRRQAHRDLRRGEQSVAEILWARLPEAVTLEENSAAQLSSVQTEMARLETYLQPTDVGQLLQRAREAVAQMAAQRGVTLDVQTPPKPAIVPTDGVLARQVLVDALSRAVEQARPGPLHAFLVLEDACTWLTLRYAPAPGAGETRAVSPVVAQLLDRLGWEMTQEQGRGPAGERSVSLCMPARCPTVLVIDDNEGLVDLLSDYLTGHACWVTSATNGPEGLRLAQTLVPDTIVLDVMMPEMDGWEILQRLRNTPQTADVPVIVCSVINNPELAYSLQASLFLTKPVSRDDVLDALRQLGVT